MLYYIERKDHFEYLIIKGPIYHGFDDLVMRRYWSHVMKHERVVYAFGFKKKTLIKLNKKHRNAERPFKSGSSCLYDQTAQLLSYHGGFFLFWFVGSCWITREDDERIHREWQEKKLLTKHSRCGILAWLTNLWGKLWM